MAGQSISFTKPNDEWLKAQVDSNEYSSKSELVNDFMRQAGKQQVHMDRIRTPAFLPGFGIVMSPQQTGETTLENQSLKPLSPIKDFFMRLSQCLFSLFQ